jgi:hypothetical protein
MATLSELRLTAAHILDHSVALYGPTESGKSVIIEHIMHLLKPHVEIAIVVCPTNVTHHMYDAIVDPIFIYDEPVMTPPAKDMGRRRVTLIDQYTTFLNAIWDYQTARGNAYRRANRPEVIDALFQRCVPPSEITEFIAGVQHMHDTQKHKFGALEWTRIEAICQDEILKAKKRAIRLAPPEPRDEEERYTLEFIDLNPHLLLVFDDCAASGFFKVAAFKRYFYQGRHNFITMLISCQDDIELEAHYRKNVFISFFSNSGNYMRFFTRKSNAFTADEQRRAMSAHRVIYKDAARPFQKGVYVRNDPTNRMLYTFSANRRPFTSRFGTRALHAFSARVKQDERANRGPLHKYFTLAEG